MTQIEITISQDGLQERSIEKIIREKVQDKFPDADISVRKVVFPTSRSDRWEEAVNQIGAAKDTAEQLRDELQEWLDNLPENLQQSNKADELQSAIDELEEAISELESAEGHSPEFPSMMG